MTAYKKGQFTKAAATALVDVTIVMPCLNEAISLPVCIRNAQEALLMMQEQLGLTGEILIADNGSTDGSQALAEAAGARVVAVSERGYGAALIGGASAAFGRYIVFGDADGSYDFRESCAMVAELVDGADVCMGSRFRGGIAPGAMPWKNRYIGNPALTGVLNLLFRAGVDDAHCGLRALTLDAFDGLHLSGTGMEFASEMVIKAALKKYRIAEVPATLSPDLRDRQPHLRPWRDGWRHLRYLLMLSPTSVFAVPAIIGALVAMIIFAGAILNALLPSAFPPMFGNYWQIAGSALASMSHMALILAVAGHLYGLRAGYRIGGRVTSALGRALSLETMLIAGFTLISCGALVLGLVAWSWSTRDFGPTYSVLPAVIGTMLATLGVQNVFGGFLLAIVGGNEARFLQIDETKPSAFPTRSARGMEQKAA